MVSKINKLFLILLLTTNCYAQNWKQAEALLEESNQLAIAMVKLEKETSDYIKYLEETELERELEGIEARIPHYKMLHDEQCQRWERESWNQEEVIRHKARCKKNLKEYNDNAYRKIAELKERIAIQDKQRGYSYTKRGIEE